MRIKWTALLSDMHGCGLAQEEGRRIVDQRWSNRKAPRAMSPWGFYLLPMQVCVAQEFGGDLKRGSQVTRPVCQEDPALRRRRAAETMTIHINSTTKITANTVINFSPRVL
jgi:hypothetical protein